MNLKEFLKPDWRKIMVFLIFMLVSYFVTFPGPETSVYRGFPFNYIISGCLGEPSSPCYDNYIYWNYLILAILVFYFLSCFIVWIYDKFKVKKK